MVIAPSFYCPGLSCVVFSTNIRALRSAWKLKRAVLLRAPSPEHPF